MGMGKSGSTNVARNAVLAALALFTLHCKTGAKPQPPPVQPWEGSIESATHAGKDIGNGLELCTETACKPAAVGDKFPNGTRLKTDGRTRVFVALNDGSKVVLDSSSELTLVPRVSHAARLVKGAAAISAPNQAKLETSGGRVEGSDARFEAIADGIAARVSVTHGTVRLHASAEANDAPGTTVLAGEEARITPSGAIAFSTSRSRRELAEVGASQDVNAPPRGVGELRARVPGATDEKSRLLHISKLAITTRISDTFARTEVEEVFSSDSTDVLEGIYRFPLPPDAQIETLALEVEGKLVQGSFVERDKAKRIFKGAVANAIKPQGSLSSLDVLWQPGPWRDPALLEWQRGGRFELKVFPIEAKSSRRVVLAYTQSLPPGPSTRRYTYDLAYDATSALAIDTFSADVQIIGHARAAGAQTRGYPFQSATPTEKEAERFTFNATSFVPAGDFTVDFAVPNDEREVTAYGYEMAAPPSVSLGAPGGNNIGAKVEATPGFAVKRPAVEPFPSTRIEAPYVAIALRPKLPRWIDSARRDYVLVVDASRSMAGERFGRATQMAAALAGELDPRDRFVVLACDESCNAMRNTLTTPTATTASDVAKFLADVHPEGGTDVFAAVRAATKLAAEGRDLRIVYIGDGIATAGPMKGAHLESVIEKSLPAKATVTAVAIGSDSDTTALSSIARGGGGTVVPFLPGQSTPSAARAVIAATYGIALRAPVLTLPDGLTQMVPQKLDNIPVGGETIVVVRSRDRAIDGEITLKGTVGGDPFEQKYPLHLQTTFSAANAFVPRLAASARIADLERLGGESSKAEMIALSTQFGVPSPYTSLLVLESEAMFQAFGIDRAQIAPVWTGSLLTQSATSGAAGVLSSDEEQAEMSLKGALSATPGSSGLTDGPAASKGAGLNGISGGSGGSGEAGLRGSGAGSLSGLGGLGGGRRYETKWTRTATVALTDESVTPSQIATAEENVAKNPDSKTKVAALYRLYARSGRIEQASELVTKWILRDPLDPDATRARADLAARLGDRALALRIIGGVADARPTDTDTHVRLAKTFDALGETDRACAHRVALAEIRPSVTSTTEAIRCARQAGMAVLADALRADLTEAMRTDTDKALTAPPPTLPAGLLGDIQLDATWDADVDLDLALVDLQGRRLSWLGAGGTAYTVTTPTGHHSEAIGYISLAGGSYAIEIVRASKSADEKPVTGSVVVRALGQTQKLPFTLSGVRGAIGRIDVKVESHEELISEPNQQVPRPTGTVTMGSPTSTSPIANMPRVIAMQRPAIRACYMQGLNQDPTLQGKLVVQVKVGPNGDVSSTQVTSNAGLSDGVVSCVSMRLRRAAFDPPDGGAATVSVPMTFNPAK